MEANKNAEAPDPQISDKFGGFGDTQASHVFSLTLSLPQTQEVNSLLKFELGQGDKMSIFHKSVSKLLETISLLYI